MLDSTLRPYVDPPLNRVAAWLAARKVTPNAVTMAGFALGLAAAAAIGFGAFLSGLALMAASRLCDGLDGAVARLTGKTDLGGFLDLVLDFGFYGIVPLGFAFADADANALPAAFLMLSFYFNGSSFLAFAAIAEKRGIAASARGDKSLLFTTGLAEATETYAAFAAMCLFPAAFGILAWSFGAICLYTAASRVALAIRDFR
jgi:phosphatidylglycerophosphate synthase